MNKLRRAVQWAYHKVRSGLNWVNREWSQVPQVVRVVVAAGVSSALRVVRVHATGGIIPSAPTFTSTEFTTIQTETADIVLALTWVVTAVIAVIAVSILFRGGKKVLRKLSP